MGKFDGVLIVSDYDNTLVYTEDALSRGGELPPVSQENVRAIHHFMDQGGTFCVATGRALPAFAPLASGVPMNGPTILFNGGAIYDFFRKEYLYTAFLPDQVREHMAQLLEALPGVAFEIYHDNNEMHAINPNELTRNHLHLTHSPTVTLNSIFDAPLPIMKLLFEEYQPKLGQIADYIRSQPWGGAYEIFFSSHYLLEVTAKGANKGGMVRRLVDILGADPQHLYCIGDHTNDIPMLQAARIPFAPANAIETVRQLEGIRILPDCRENTIAAMISELEKIYS